MGRTDKNFETRRAQILEAATTVFATHGYRGASNKRIADELARRTGTSITPQLLYHYFEGKPALFRAVMQQFPPPQRIRASIEAASELPLEAFLRALAQAYLALLDDPQAAAVLRIATQEGVDTPEVAELVAEVLVPAYVEPLGRYLIEEQRRGGVRACPPALVLLGLLGPLLLSRSPVSRAMAARMKVPPLADDVLIEGVVANLVTGLRPRSEA